MKTPKILWHATPRINLSAILSEGIRTGPDGRVWLSNNKDQAVKFSKVHHDDAVFSIIPVMCEEIRIYPDVGCFYSLEPIQPDRIDSENVIHKRS